MAAYRAVENQKSDRLFFDPFAAKLATPEGEAIALEDPEEDRAYWAARTRFFDDFLLNAAHVALNLSLDIQHFA